MVIKNVKFKHIYWIFFYLLIFSFIFFNSFNYLDPDLGWHLKTGQDILNEKKVPSLNYYNYTLEGQKWIDHEWLINIIMYLLFNNFNYFVLSLFFALIFISTILLLHIFSFINFGDKKNSLFLFSFFIIFGTISIAPQFGVRAQELSVLNILLTLIILFYYAKNKNKKILLFLLPLFYFWANAHASFVLGIFVLFFFLIIKITEINLKKYSLFDFLSFKYILSKKELLIFAIFALLSSLTVLFTPYGLKIINLFNRIHVSGAFHLKAIIEWLPAYSVPVNYYQLIYGAIAVAILFLYIFSSITEKKDGIKIDLWFLSLSFLFLFLAFKSKRHFPFFFIASFPLIINFCTWFFKINNNKIKKYINNNILLNIFIVLCLILSSSVLIIKTNYTNEPFSSKLYCESFPCEGVEFLKNNPEYKNLKLFNQFGWGGYLIWDWPDKKIFIDGRLPQYPLAGHTILAEYYEFFEKDNTENKLNQYNIESILVRKQKNIELNWFEKYILGIKASNFHDIKNHFKDYLNSTAKWQKAYEDDACVIYILRL